MKFDENVHLFLELLFLFVFFEQFEINQPYKQSNVNASICLFECV